MATLDLDGALDREKRDVDKALGSALRSERRVPTRLKAAMAHSLLGGGKRLRPVLLLWTWDAVRQKRRRPPRGRDQALIAACALEMLHTYSLIHDDLPAMDDDDLRRGRPSCHVAFDEATAILAGDGLQAMAFRLLARSGGPLASDLVELIADAVGPAGMVGGQQLDLEAEQQEVAAHLVRRIHRDKTARMLAASLAAGALLGGASAERRARIESAGIHLGLAFQGADDLLDARGDSVALGKRVGKDAGAGKATWVDLEGEEAAVRRTRRHGEKGVRELERGLPAGPRAELLVGLARRMWIRDR